MSNCIISYNPKFKEYAADSFKKIEGACDVRVFYSLQIMLSALGKIDSKKIAEIGVRDGRFFIGILKLLPVESTGLAIDLFDQQQHNIDGSGWRPASHGVPFFEHVDSILENPDRVSFIKKDSLDLSISDIIAIATKYGPFNIFSVDGGHEAEHLVNDLSVAEQTIEHSGIILLDDYYNPNFPGVHEGFAAYMQQKKKTVPILYSTGKLYLCTKSYYPRYLKFLKKNFNEINTNAKYAKWTRMFGYEVLHIAM